MANYPNVNWLDVDPYDIGRKDENLPGYGAVLRYWQRISLLYEEEALDRILLQKLLARELAHWQVLIFEPVFVRKNIYVRETIRPFVEAVERGPAKRAYAAGLRDGANMKRKNASAARALQSPINRLKRQPKTVAIAACMTASLALMVARRTASR